MPEGPSILLLKKQLQPFVGKTVKRAGGYGPMPTDWINGRKLKEVQTHGKHLYFIFTNGVVQLHLGLFGDVLINERKKVNRKFFLEFAKGEINGYVVSVKKIESKEDLFDPRTDILSSGFDAAYVKSLIGKKPEKEIAALLMDQQIFSGAGNKIRVEALYRAGIHPLSKAGKIPPKALSKLITAVRNYAKTFYHNLERAGTNKDFKAYQQEHDQQGNEITMKYLAKEKRKVYFSERVQKLYS
ncbi:DNA-formamidopyrimidine glycosylase family protein [Niabella yanshanensis]|uniref:DNA-formamidopyrimidine glycosylase family protein n=1 Tax=Niabella yanshanensis TaxID=577386 RepID=A0ABZ0W0T9_9BACT|nr:DNA-formamidopyrimidine glycosylase family protein [Niabella yanshanensis]WQD36875.1 DNA-formamidopyrimidine glycosylase family protein [Niabella yanshanensis]